MPFVVLWIHQRDKVDSDDDANIFVQNQISACISLTPLNINAMKWKEARVHFLNVESSIKYK